MNVYDFDKTIFYPDSSVTFVRWEARRHPLYLLVCLPAMLFYGILFKLRFIPKKHFKESLFRIIRAVPDLDADVKQFWDEHEGQICPWYLRQKCPDDLIISASPEFLVREMTDRLGISLLGTPMDKHTAKILGENCFGAEKVRRFYESYPDGRIEEFYSDSLSDAPLADISEKAFLIVDKGQTPVPWP